MLWAGARHRWSACCSGYPLAWVIAASRRHRALLLFLVVLPFWTSFLVRTFAMIFLLRDTGLINSVLLRAGLIERAARRCSTPRSPCSSGLVYGFLPFMVLPIYASLEKLDPALLEAAEVLGARPGARFFRVALPLSLPGVIAGCLLVFVPALGSVPHLGSAGRRQAGDDREPGAEPVHHGAELALRRRGVVRA